jgi:hypothetical protein
MADDRGPNRDGRHTSSPAHTLSGSTFSVDFEHGHPRGAGEGVDGGRAFLPMQEERVYARGMQDGGRTRSSWAQKAT